MPEALPDLDVKASYGLVTAEEFKLPSPNPLWTPDSYKCFNIAANVGAGGDKETVSIIINNALCLIHLNKGVRGVILVRDVIAYLSN